MILPRRPASMAVFYHTSHFRHAMGVPLKHFTWCRSTPFPAVLSTFSTTRFCWHQRESACSPPPQGTEQSPHLGNARAKPMTQTKPLLLTVNFAHISFALSLQFPLQQLPMLCSCRVCLASNQQCFVTTSHMCKLRLCLQRLFYMYLLITTVPS
jgi:hypothetical protein